MTRELIKPIEIELKGGVYELYLDFTAMKDFEDMTSKTVLQFLKPFVETIKAALESEEDNNLKLGFSAIEGLIAGGQVSAGDIQALLWACIGGRDSGKTPREVGRMVNVSNISLVASKLWEAIQTAWPKAETTDEPAEGADPNLSSPAG